MLSHVQETGAHPESRSDVPDNIDISKFQNHPFFTQLRSAGKEKEFLGLLASIIDNVNEALAEGDISHAKDIIFAAHNAFEMAFIMAGIGVNEADLHHLLTLITFPVLNLSESQHHTLTSMTSSQVDAALDHLDHPTKHQAAPRIELSDLLLKMEQSLDRTLSNTEVGKLGRWVRSTNELFSSSDIETIQVQYDGMCLTAGDDPYSIVLLGEFSHVLELLRARDLS